MSKTSLQTKWDQIYSDRPDPEPLPAVVLSENAHLLPRSGDALDLACGLGGNALFLAQKGFKVTAWDISPVAIHALAGRAASSTLNLEAQVRDVEAELFPVQGFDVVVVSRFLSRPLARPILDCLKPSGLLFYQTYVIDKPGSQGPSNPAYLLAENELLTLFAGMRLLAYREEGRVGDLNLGRRDEAYFVGRKR